jgi:hypothetical protein
MYPVDVGIRTTASESLLVSTVPSIPGMSPCWMTDIPGIRTPDHIDWKTQLFGIQTLQHTVTSTAVQCLILVRVLMIATFVREQSDAFGRDSQRFVLLVPSPESDASGIAASTRNRRGR